MFRPVAARHLTTSATAWWWPGTPTTSPSSRRPDHALAHRIRAVAGPRVLRQIAHLAPRRRPHHDPRAAGQGGPGAAATGRSAAARPAAGSLAGRGTRRAVVAQPARVRQLPRGAGLPVAD